MSNYSDLQDEQLLNLLNSGDSAAFSEIYSRYWEFLYQSAYAILKDNDICDDLVQDIFVWLWLNREKHITDAFKPYLYAAVKYKVANVIRHGKIKESFFAQTVANYKESSTEQNNVELKELKEIIAQFTKQLPERARLIFHLSRNEFLSNYEIAEKLGISEKTVENQMNINLKKLKFSLGRLSVFAIFL